MSRAVLIVGAGPAGLATAACLKRRGVEADLVDRHGVPGGAYRRIYPGVVLASPARYTALPGLAPRAAGEYISVPEYRDYLERYAAHHGLQVRKACVVGIEKRPEGFEAGFEEGKRSYGAVVVATGLFDFPRRPALEGAIHSSEWRGPQHLPGPRVLIVGGATSAIEVAEECARAGLRPLLSLRSALRIAPQRYLGRDLHDFVVALAWLPRAFARAYCEGRQSLPGADLGFREFVRRGAIGLRGEVTAVEGRQARFADGTREEFDVLVAATGYRYASELAAVPGVHVVGRPCERRLTSEFLYGIAKDAPEVARCLS
jgi:putative flavoprotein involved in K+ transport